MTDTETHQGKKIAPKLRWVQQMLASEPSDEWCVIFPFARHIDGYGQVYVDGKVMGAHRYVCFLVHGEPPTPEHEAAHSCDRGKHGCVNPRHLRWKTKTENRREAPPRPQRKLTSTAMRQADRRMLLPEHQTPRHLGLAIMSNEPFGRQPLPVTIKIEGESPIDIDYWWRHLKRAAEFKGDMVEESDAVSARAQRCFKIFPRAVND